MLRLNIHQAKTHLSRYLERVERGETIVLCRRNVPIAEIRPLPPERGEIPPPGLWRDEIEVPETFFEPLPPDLLDRFEGRGEAD